MEALIVRLDAQKLGSSEICTVLVSMWGLSLKGLFIEPSLATQIRGLGAAEGYKRQRYDGMH